MRSDERRIVLGAFVVLFGLMAGHTVLETARDALFLARLPASHLPIVYLAIVAAGLVVARGAKSTRASAAGLSTALLVSAVVTALFWLVRGWKGTWFLYALYVWAGVVASWVMIQFWLVIGGAFTVTQAKRLFGFIGAGSVLGAVSGAAAARGLLSMTSPEHLLVCAAALFAITGFGPVWLLKGVGAAAPRSARKTRGTRAARSPMRVVVGHPYLLRILLMVIASTLTLTLVDYLFKAIAKQQVPSDELGVFFANAYLVFNAASFAIQVLVVGWLLRTFGVQRALWALPLLLTAGSVALVVFGGLWLALALKGADGGLRHSLHGTSMELLYVPTPDALRAKAKPLIDLVGRRGGQALASVAILALVSAGIGLTALAVVAAILGCVWVAVVFTLRRHYLDIFRTTLQEGRIDYEGALPPFDLGALESLISALNSDKDPEVIGALDLLAAQRRHDLIPALVLYHPSDPIVLRALDHLVDGERDDIAPVANRLLEHENPDVQTAALRARMSVAPDEPFLRGCLDHSSAEVRATALIGLAARGWLSDADLERAVGFLLEENDPRVLVALARAIALESAEKFSDVALSLTDSEHVDVRSEALRALGKIARPEHLPLLVRRLAVAREAGAAREALVAMGDDGLEYVERAMNDDSLPIEIQRALPRALSMFFPRAAAPALMAHLSTASDPITRSRVLRGLCKLRTDDPDLELDSRSLDRAIDEAVREAFVRVSWRAALESRRNSLETDAAYQLIVTFLRDMEEDTFERIFRLLGLRYPQENFTRIYRGLKKGDPKARASSCELIENLIQPPLRRGLLALVEEDAGESRLKAAPASYRADDLEYNAALEALSASNPELSSLVEHHLIATGSAHADVS